MKLKIKLVPRRNKIDYDIIVSPKKSNSTQKRLDTLGSLIYSSELKSRILRVHRRKLAVWVYNGAELSKSLYILLDVFNSMKVEYGHNTKN